MYRDGQKCPICGLCNLVKKVVDETFEYKGEKLVVPDYVIYECSTCEDSLVDEKSIKASQKELKDFYRKVDGLLSSADIRRIRKKLGYTQEQMAKELGVGLKNFARYESGQVIQGRAMDLLLRVFDFDPAILKKIKQHDGRQVLRNKGLS